MTDKTWHQRAAELAIDGRAFIAGERRAALDGQSFDKHSPIDGRHLAPIGDLELAPTAVAGPDQRVTVAPGGSLLAAGEEAPLHQPHAVHDSMRAALVPARAQRAAADAARGAVRGAAIGDREIAPAAVVGPHGVPGPSPAPGRAALAGAEVAHQPRRRDPASRRAEHALAGIGAAPHEPRAGGGGGGGGRGGLRRDRGCRERERGQNHPERRLHGTSSIARVVAELRPPIRIACRQPRCREVA